MPTLYEQVRARLIEGISEGRWRPGEAIPSESQLGMTAPIRGPRSSPSICSTRPAASMPNRLRR